MKTLSLEADLYRQFDADYTLPYPAEGYGGWHTVPVSFALERTALVPMHAWYGGAMGEFPGWDRCVEYRPRSYDILRDVFPPLLAATRSAGMPVVHVGGRKYYQSHPGYLAALALAGPEPEKPDGALRDETLEAARAVRSQHTFVGEHNQADVDAGYHVTTFAPEAMPVDGEYVCGTAHQLNAVCRKLGVSHLVYIGFAINACLMISPCGMVDMSRYGYTCSAIREAVTAVENKESIRGERHKETALWSVSLSYGFVFRVEPFIAALRAAR